VLALLLSLTVPLHAAEPGYQRDGARSSVRTAGSLGLGLGAGTSTGGISGKYWADESMAFQAVIGAGYGQVSDRGGWSSGIGLSGDLLFEGPSFAVVDDVEFGWSVGPGLGLWANDDYFALAAAGVAGLELALLVFPLDFVVEYRPRMLVVPSVGFDWVNFSAHVRYYFK
jgi:hypothetical protein